MFYKWASQYSDLLWFIEWALPFQRKWKINEACRKIISIHWSVKSTQSFNLNGKVGTPWINKILKWKDIWSSVTQPIACFGSRCAFVMFAAITNIHYADWTFQSTYFLVIHVLISSLRSLKLLKIILKQLSMFLSFQCFADISLFFLHESMNKYLGYRL